MDNTDSSSLKSAQNGLGDYNQTNMSSFNALQNDYLSTGSTFQRNSDLSSLASSYNDYSSFGTMNQGSFGSYNSYGGGYYGNNNSYGGFNRFGGGYGNHNQQMHQMNQQGAQPGKPPIHRFRDDIWGVLNGALSIISVAYAGTGIMAFGRTFVETTIRILKTISNKSFGLIMRLTGVYYIKKLVSFLKTGGKKDWASQISADNLSDSLWNDKPQKGLGFSLGKVLQVLRILAMIGFAASLVFKRREQKRVEAYELCQKECRERLEQEAQQITSLPQIAEVSFVKEDSGLNPEEISQSVVEEEVKILEDSTKEESVELANNETVNTEEVSVAQEQSTFEEPKCHSEEYWQSSRDPPSYQIEKQIEEITKETPPIVIETPKVFELPSMLKDIPRKPASKGLPWAKKVNA